MVWERVGQGPWREGTESGKGKLGAEGASCARGKSGQRGRSAGAVDGPVSKCVTVTRNGLAGLAKASRLQAKISWSELEDAIGLEQGAGARTRTTTLA